MGNFRNKQVLGFKLRAMPSSTTQSSGVPLRPARGVCLARVCWVWSPHVSYLVFFSFIRWVVRDFERERKRGVGEDAYHINITFTTVCYYNCSILLLLLLISYCA